MAAVEAAITAAGAAETTGGATTVETTEDTAGAAGVTRAARVADAVEGATMTLGPEPIRAVGAAPPPIVRMRRSPRDGLLP